MLAKRCRPSILLAAMLATALITAPVTAKAAQAQPARRQASQAPVAATDDPAARSNQGGTPTIGTGARGAAVARAQVLLDRAWFSPGEIDGRFSNNMRRAVLAYQAANALAGSGKVDAATWAALGSDGVPAFAAYRVTAQDAAGPYTKTPSALAERGRLKSLDYESLREALSERFHMSQALLSEMNRGRKTFQAGDLIVVADIATGPGTAPAGAKSIQIDKSQRMLYVVGATEKVLAAFPVSIGGPLDPLPPGTMKITNEVKNPSFTYDPELLKRAKRGEVKTRIAPGPNNPVGNMWLGLSKPHWGIHGTPDPARLGRTQTNGCIHLTNWDAQRLSLLAKVGFVVDVRE